MHGIILSLLAERLKKILTRFYVKGKIVSSTRVASSFGSSSRLLICGCRVQISGDSYQLWFNKTLRVAGVKRKETETLSHVYQLGFWYLRL